MPKTFCHKNKNEITKNQINAKKSLKSCLLGVILQPKFNFVEFMQNASFALLLNMLASLPVVGQNSSSLTTIDLQSTIFAGHLPLLVLPKNAQQALCLSGQIVGMHIFAATN